MKHFFALCLLSFVLLSGRAQSYLLHPNQLDTVALADSIWAGVGRDGFRQNGGAVGQLNGRYPATLLDDSGVVLVAKTAIQLYARLEDTTQVVICPVPLPLKSVVISFPLEAEELSAQILPTERPAKSDEEQIAHIQRQITELQRQADPDDRIRTVIRPYQQQTRFFRHHYRDFTEVALLAYTNFGEGTDYALLRILGESPYPTTPQINRQDSAEQVAYTINYPPQTHYHHSASALILQLQALESSLSILESALSVYQSYSRLPPEALTNFYLQQVGAYRYLQVGNALSRRRGVENQLLIYPSLSQRQEALDQKVAELEALHRFYQSSQSLNQSVQLISLSRFLERQQSRRSDVNQRALSFLDSWAKDWNATIDQALFTKLMPLYFDESQADYFSSELIDQIRSSEKSFELLGRQIYRESLLAKPQQLRSLLSEKGSEALFQALERDLGYLFFRQLLRDQQEKVFRPYRKALQEWTALERKWLRAIAKVKPPSYLDGNATQRFHLLASQGISALPAWEGSAGSPLFNRQHALIGFAFPQNGSQAGVEWSINQEEVTAYYVHNMKEVLQTLAGIKW